MVTTTNAMRLMNQAPTALVAMDDTNATDTLKCRGQITYLV